MAKLKIEAFSISASIPQNCGGPNSCKQPCFHIWGARACYNCSLRVYFCVLACIGHWPRLLSRSVRVERGSRCDSWLRMNLSYEANPSEDSFHHFDDFDDFSERIPSWFAHERQNSQPLPNLQDPRQVGSSWQYFMSLAKATQPIRYMVQLWVSECFSLLF